MAANCGEARRLSIRQRAPSAMSFLRASSRAALALWFVAFPVRGWGQAGPLRIPGPGDGYQITRTDASQAAPAGYDGRTDTSTLTAVGNTPATTGRRVVARFTLGNQIKTCPQADGTAEGEGVFSMSADFTDTRSSGTSRVHIEMRAKGKYKGQVGDDAWIINPVKGDIEYTYTLSGAIRDVSGAIATPAGSNVAQRITIPFAVGKDLAVPTIGPFSGGDPAQGHYADAVGAGTALVFWAGIYYSTAQVKWRQPGTCVKVRFSPPSYTVRLVPGGQTTVKAEVNTKAGEVTKAQFQGARPLSGLSSVTPSEGPSDVGSPMTFSYTAPIQRGNKAGFLVDAMSRAGVASGEWDAGLGTNWSGNISLTVTSSGDQGENEFQSWSNSSVTRITVVLIDGKGTATGYTEVHYLSRQRQKALRGGAITVITSSSQTMDGSLEDKSEAAVGVFDLGNGTYTIRVSYDFSKEGKTRVEDCGRDTCTESEGQLLMGATVPGMDGKTDDPNHLSGSKTDVKTGTGYKGAGTVTSTIKWNLAREGSGKSK